MGRGPRTSPGSTDRVFPSHPAGFGQGITKGQPRTAPEIPLLHIIRTDSCQELPLIILGVILLIIGFVAKIAILWTIGIVIVVIGAILALLGTVGHAVGGRRHYF